MKVNFMEAYHNNADISVKSQIEYCMTNRCPSIMKLICAWRIIIQLIILFHSQSSQRLTAIIELNAGPSWIGK
jgi:hypothetical protein